VPQGQLTLVDVQTEMLAAARLRLPRVANVSYATADACALPVRTASVDAVFLATVLGEVPDKDLCVEEVRRSLRPGGLLTIVETRRDSDFIPLASVCELLARHGFSFVDRRGPPWQYAARFRTGERATTSTG